VVLAGLYRACGGFDYGPAATPRRIEARFGGRLEKPLLQRDHRTAAGCGEIIPTDRQGHAIQRGQHGIVSPDIAVHALGQQTGDRPQNEPWRDPAKGGLPGCLRAAVSQFHCGSHSLWTKGPEVSPPGEMLKEGDRQTDQEGGQQKVNDKRDPRP